MDDELLALQAVLAAAVVRVLAAGSHFWATTDLTMPQLKVLLLLSDVRSAPVSWLATSTNVSSPNITGIVGRLEERGWARRDVDRHDRRVVRVSLTDAGQDVLQRVCLAGVESLVSSAGSLEQGHARKLRDNLEGLLQASAEAGAEGREPAPSNGHDREAVLAGATMRRLS